MFALSVSANPDSLWMSCRNWSVTTGAGVPIRGVEVEVAVQLSPGGITGVAAVAPLLLGGAELGDHQVLAFLLQLEVKLVAAEQYSWSRVDALAGSASYLHVTPGLEASRFVSNSASEWFSVMDEGARRVPPDATPAGPFTRYLPCPAGAFPFSCSPYRRAVPSTSLYVAARCEHL